MYSVVDVVAVIVVLYSENNAHRERKNIIITRASQSAQRGQNCLRHTPKKKEQRDVKQWEKVSVTFLDGTFCIWRFFTVLKEVDINWGKLNFKEF
jgi:hypothetical protein